MPTAFVLTLLLFALLSALGVVLAQAGKWPLLSPWILALFLVLSLPALSYAGYYLHLIDEPVLLYRLRALPGSELLAALIGIPLGWIGAILARHEKRVVRLLIIGFAFGPMVLLIPYAKEILSPLDPDQMQERWSDDVCMQSTGSTCGPSSAATLLRSFGIAANERELAIAAHTTTGGTEIWYLARALRERGLTVSFMTTAPNPTTLPFPAIAGTRVGDNNGTGHFITVLGREGERYIIGDPLSGRPLLAPADIGNTRYFTGFFLLVGRP